MGPQPIEQARDYLAAAYTEAAKALENGMPARAGATACGALTRAADDGMLWVYLAETFPQLGAFTDATGAEALSNLAAFVDVEVNLFAEAGLPRDLAWDLAQSARLHLKAATENPGALQLELLRQQTGLAAVEVCKAAESLRSEEMQQEIAGTRPESKARRIMGWLGRADGRVVQIVKGCICLGGLVVVVADVAGVPHTGGLSLPSIYAGAKMIVGEAG